MKIVRAKHLGMCFGVRDAIELAQEQNRQSPVTVLGSLVHNETVIRQLRRDGIRIEDRMEKIGTRRVVITAHGASHQRIGAVRAKGHEVVEATCPLVRFAHDQLMNLVRSGFHPVVIGRKGHVEVKGLTEDLAEFDVVESEEDIAQMNRRPAFGVIAQTTQPVARVEHYVNQIRNCFPLARVEWVDTVCRPTKQRQSAAEQLARTCDVVVVIGGTHSNNTRELARTCGRLGASVHQVQTAADLRKEWFHPRAVVGVTAGTSTPDVSIDEVERWLRRLNTQWLTAGKVSRKRLPVLAS